MEQILKVLAHSVVFFKNEEYHNVSLMACGGDPVPQNTSESMNDILAAYQANLPGLLDINNKQMLPTAQAQLAANQAVSDPQTALQAQLYAKYGPQLAQTASDIERQSALSSSATDAAVLAGPGKNLIDQSLAISKQADPEYYAARQLTGNKLAELLNGINTTSLTPNERREVDQSITRGAIGSGNYNNGSITQAVANAGQYGDALRTKQAALGQALGVGFQGIPSLKSSFDPVQTALGRPSQATNLAQTNFGQGAMQNAGVGASEFGQNLLGSLTQQKVTQMGINADRRDEFDRFSQGFSAGKPNCCFIFMEAYNGVLPPYVRICRDLQFTEERGRGYRLLSNILVPLMIKFDIVRQAVNEWMIQPLSEHGAWLCGYGGKAHIKANNFWMKTFAFLGRNF